MIRQKVIVVLNCLVCITLIAACGQDSEKPQEKIAPIVTVESVSEHTPARAMESRYSAIIQPTVQMDVSFKTGGYVDYIYQTKDPFGHSHPVQAGDYVRKGTLLARVRQSDYTARVNEQVAIINEIKSTQTRAEAALAAAQVALDGARTNYERTARLFQSDSVTKPDFDSSKNNLDMSEARVKEARAAVESSMATEKRGGATLTEAKLTLQDCSLYAPMDGVIIKRSIELGTLAAQGTAAFTLADASTIKVAFGVPDVALQNMKTGEILQLTVESVPGKTFQGRVTDVSPSADPNSRVFNVEVSVPNRDRQLQLGMVATLIAGDLHDQTPVLAVPLSAIVRSTSNPANYSVYLVTRQGGKSSVQEREVKLGEAFGHDITVMSGLQAGDSVVVIGSTRVTNGQEVRIADQIDTASQ